MDRIYDVTIEYLGRKKQDKFPASTICLGKDGAFLVMDSEGNGVRFVANDCRVEQIAAHVIILRGYTDKPQHVTAYCVYANASHEPRRDSGGVSVPACIDQAIEAIVARLIAKGQMYSPDAEWTRLQDCAEALRRSKRELTANDQVDGRL